jgi:hypothetical protein
MHGQTPSSCCRPHVLLRKVPSAVQYVEHAQRRTLNQQANVGALLWSLESVHPSGKVGVFQTSPGIRPSLEVTSMGG